jgi:peptide/nickel transport system ATP-binding protein/oligopeptide transport system ATP-binding protein
MSPTTQLDQPVSTSQPRQSGATPPILEIKNLHTHFFLEKGTVKAVNGVNLTLPRPAIINTR